MSRVQGTVSRLEGDMAIVEVIRSSGCGRCHEPGGCGGETLATGAACPRSYSLPNQISAKPGDKVWLAVAEGSVLKAALWAYGLPGGLMLLGALLATMFFTSDLSAFGGALVGLAAGYLLLRLTGAGQARQDEGEVLSMHSCQ